MKDFSPVLQDFMIFCPIAIMTVLVFIIVIYNKPKQFNQPTQQVIEDDYFFTEEYLPVHSSMTKAD